MSFVVSDIGTPSTPIAGATASTTLGDLVNQVRAYVYSGERVERTRLTSTINSSATTATFDYAVNALTNGGVKLSIDFEDIHQWTASSTTAVTSMQRGEFGSTAASHSSGAIVHVNAPWSQWDILRELNNELDHLSSPSAGLYFVTYIDITFNPSYVGFDLGVADLIEVIEVRAKVPNGSRNWPRINHTLIGSQNTADFPSGNSLMLTEGAYPGQPVRVFYKKAFTKFSSTPTLVDVVQTQTNLHGQAHDILAMGAALRLAGVAEIARNRTDRQGDTRRANEVTPGSKNAAPTGLQRQYLSRLAAEANRLRQDYPQRKIRR